MNNYQLSVKKYPVYKDSGIEWLGDVPEHWEVRRLKDIKANIPNAFVDGPFGSNLKTEHFIENGAVYVIDSGYITSGLFEIKREFKTISNEHFLTVNRSQCFHNDIIISKIGANFGMSGILPLLDKPSLVSGNTLKLTINRKLYNLKFIHYQLLNLKVNGVFDVLVKGSAQPALSMGLLNPIPFTTPSLQEQKSIATYLDTKTAQCDRKIDLLTQKATQYGKLKQSLINETVTRGLDKSVPMKDSGIEWIGDVPEHWEIQRLHDIAVHQKTKNIGLIEKNLLSLSYGKIKRRDIDTSFGLLPESFETYQIVEEGNIILRLTDLQNDQRSLRVGLAREKGIITSAYLCLKFLKNIHPVFAYYLLFMYDISKVFYWFGGGLRQSMKFDDVKVFPFVVPPLSEQKAIADYLDTKTAQIDQIIQTINTQIEKLKELRKTLINDVVTGKIRV
jgi:type I restriction enzyme S subunit